METLTNRISRIVLPPAGPYARFTSNVYLVGNCKKRVLIDTGNGHGDFTAFLKSSLPFTISKVVLTHSHGGHSNGLLSLNQYAKDFELLKFKSPGDSLNPRDSGKTGRLSFLDDGHIIHLNNECKLRVIHTPGHSQDSISLWLEEESCLISGDSISSSPRCSENEKLPLSHILVENLADYTASLAKIDMLGPRIIFPGHGDVILDGLQHIAAAKECVHNTAALILKIVSREAITAKDITREIVGKDSNVFLAVEGTVKQHLLILEQKGLIRRHHTVRNETENLSNEQQNMRGPGGLTFKTIFGAVKDSQRRDWSSEAMGKLEPHEFRLRDKVHPAHSGIKIPSDLLWRLSKAANEK